MELPTNPKVDMTATGAGTDLLLYLLTASRRPRIAYVSEPLAFFRSHEGSISTDGRGGRVAMSYALAKCWFAGMYGRPELVDTILAWDWLGRMRETRRWLSPFAAAERYRHLTSGLRLLGATLRLPATIAWARLSARRAAIHNLSDSSVG